MLKFWLLRIHRWMTLTFALPLAVLIVTGLILSFEPAAIGSASSGRVTAETINAVLARHDPAGTARSLIVRAYAGTVSVGGARPGDTIHVDIASNEAVASPGAWPQFFTNSRRLHETFLLDLGWLVTISTCALLMLIALGMLMGWPRLRNTLAGWHKGAGWLLLPLLIISPLTGLLLAYGVTFATPPAGTVNVPPVSLREAVRIVGTGYDLGRVTWIRPMRGALRARIDDGGEMRLFTVTANGLVPTARNWPRLIHEGNWLGLGSAAINIVTSVAFVILLTTGLLLWARRKLRPRKMRG